MKPAVDEERRAAPAGRKRLHAFGLLLVAFVSLVAGFVLALLPWTPLWQHNYFFGWLPVWGSPYTRGAVSGLGLVNIAIALSEMWRVVRKRYN